MFNEEQRAREAEMLARAKEESQAEATAIAAAAAAAAVSADQNGVPHTAATPPSQPGSSDDPMHVESAKSNTVGAGGVSTPTPMPGTSAGSATTVLPNGSYGVFSAGSSGVVGNGVMESRGTVPGGGRYDAADPGAINGGTNWATGGGVHQPTEVVGSPGGQGSGTLSTPQWLGPWDDMSEVVSFVGKGKGRCRER